MDDRLIRDRRRCSATWVAWALALAATVLLASPAQAEPNLYEQRDLEEEALRAFRQSITLWREELYFELYEGGWEASKERVPVEEFAQRMVELSWVPQGDPDPKFLKTDFRHRTMIYVYSRLLFQNKFIPEQRFSKDFSALMLKENGRWRVDLVQLVRSPHS
jgi:hypothetical protein